MNEKMKIYTITLALVVIIVLIGIPLIGAEIEQTRKLIVWLPGSMVVINTAINFFFTKRASVIVVGVLSLPFFFLGHMWFMTFVFTDYRHHLAFVGVPLSIIFFVVGALIINSKNTKIKL